MVRGIVALVATTVLLLGIPTLVSLAKGADSITLSGPGISTPIELIDHSKSFDTYESSAPVTLARMTSLGHERWPALASVPEGLGPVFILTWTYMADQNGPIELRIYVEAPGGPLIHVPEQAALDGWGKAVTGWFEAPDDVASVIEETIKWSTSEEGAALQPPAGAPLVAKGADPVNLPRSLWVAVGIFAAGVVAWSRYGPSQRRA